MEENGKIVTAHLSVSGKPTVIAITESDIQEFERGELSLEDIDHNQDMEGEEIAAALYESLPGGTLRKVFWVLDNMGVGRHE